jgi:phage tail sheath protein FI
MPEYLSPGVYIEEIEIGAKPIEGVSTSTAGFLGLTERGPTEVQFVTGFAQFQRLYGGFVKDFYLPYAVDGFFRNGGQRCFIGRIVRIDRDNPANSATAAELTRDPVTFEAVGEGVWGKRVAIRIEGASVGDPALFKLTVAYWSKGIPTNLNVAPLTSPPDDTKLKRSVRQLLETAAPVEVFDNLSTDPDSPDFYEKRINGTANLIKVTSTGAGKPANTDPFILMEPLLNGSDGAGTKPDRNDFLGDELALPGERRGLTAFGDIDEISIINVPDLHLVDLAQRDTLIDDVLSQCETLKDRFAIFEASSDDQNYKKIDKVGWTRPSKYGALYYPWIEVFDPITQLPKSIPPGGYIAGIYARTDQERGVHKAPANEVVRGATDVDIKVTKGDQDFLNPKGVNAIRVFPGRGIRVWGARNMILDPLWKYINVRRLFIFLEESIDEGTQTFVFEPNNEKLWDRVKQTITQFLTRVWRDGALMGTAPEQAFFVKVDRTTMTQDDIDNGRLIVLIGVAPVKPAEFVIVRIAQTRGGAEVSEG